MSLPRIAVDAMGGDEGVRVMVEGEDGVLVQALCSELAEVVKRAVG